MVQSLVQTNNNRIVFGDEYLKEYVQPNMYESAIGNTHNSVIVNYMARGRYDSQGGGAVVNVPLYRALKGAGVGTGTLTGQEEAIDNYGMRVFCDWRRHAIKMSKSEMMKEEISVFEKKNSLLRDWINEYFYQDITAAYMALPSETANARLGLDSGYPVNGILYETATAAQRNTWNANNSDRVLYGNLKSNYNATHATALANVDTTADTFTEASVRLLGLIADAANPAITPYKTRDGYSGYMAFAGPNTFDTLSNSMATRWQYGMQRGSTNPLFREGDIEVGNIIVRKVPAISRMVDGVWTSLKTAGASSARVEPVFLCGQASQVRCLLEAPAYNDGDQTDYGFQYGRGVSAGYGYVKTFDKSLTDTKLVQRGVVTGFFAVP